jgi:glycosyltransferase involved in cell wall biosynthesis
MSLTNLVAAARQKIAPPANATGASEAVPSAQQAADETSAAELARTIAEIREPGLNTLPIILNHLGLKADCRVLDIGGAVQGGQESTRFLLEAFDGPIDAVGKWDPAQRVAAAKAYGGRVRLRTMPDPLKYHLVLLCPVMARTLSDLHDFVSADSGVVAPGGVLIAHGVLPGVIDDPAFIQPPPPVAEAFVNSFSFSADERLQLPAYLAEYSCYGVFRRKTKSNSFLGWYVLRKRSEEETHAAVAAKPAEPDASGKQTRPVVARQSAASAGATVAAGDGRASGPASPTPGEPFAARCERLLAQISRFGPPQYDLALRALEFEEVPAEVSEVLRSRRFDSVMFVNNRFVVDARPMKMVQALADFGRKPLAIGVNPEGEYGVDTIGGTTPLILLPNYNTLSERLLRQLELPRLVGPRYELWMAATAVCLTNLLIELPDKPPLLILHSHDFTGAYVGGNVVRLVRAAPEMARTAIKWVHDIHEFVREYDIIDPTLQEIACAWEGAFYPRADALVTVTQPLSDKICQFYDVRTPPAVLYNCNRLSAKHKYKGPGCREVAGCGDAPLMVHSGAIKPGRGVEYLIRAMAALPDLHLMLITGTEGDYLSQLLGEADGLGVRERVHLQPLLPYDEVAGFIADADAGMIPMDHYGNSDVSLPNKFFDYINAELPVISADTDNLRELMTEWPVGRLFPAGDVAALTAAIGDALSQGERYRNAIRSRPDLILGFAWEAQAVKLYDIYRGLVRGQPGRYKLQLPEY